MTDRLPIYEIARDIIALLQVTRRGLMSAPTDAGKFESLHEQTLPLAEAIG